jgi:hypothetical protein
MFRASVFGRKDRLLADASSGKHLHGGRYRLLRFEALDDRLLMAVGAPDLPVNLSNGMATGTVMPPTTSFVNFPVDVAPPSPASTAQSAVPTPDSLLSGILGIPIPVVVPDARSWAFEAGGGGFAPPAIDNASDNDYPIALESAPGGTGASFVLEPALDDQPAIDGALAQFKAIVHKAETAEDSTTQPDAAELFDMVTASAEKWAAPSATALEISEAGAAASL